MAVRTESKAQDPEPRHPCDDPNISGTEFLYAVMRDRSLPLTQRINAAAKIMRLYPDESFTPSLTIRIPDCHDAISTAPAPVATDGRLGERSHFSPPSHITP